MAKKSIADYFTKLRQEEWPVNCSNCGTTNTLKIIHEHLVISDETLEDDEFRETYKHSLTKKLEQIEEYESRKQ